MDDFRPEERVLRPVADDDELLASRRRIAQELLEQEAQYRLRRARTRPVEKT